MTAASAAFSRIHDALSDGRQVKLSDAYPKYRNYPKSGNNSIGLEFKRFFRQAKKSTRIRITGRIAQNFNAK